VTALSLKGVAAGIFVVAAAAVCIRLGFWQLDRLDQRRAVNEAFATALRLPPLNLDGAGLDTVLAHPAAQVYRRGTARGVFDHSSDLLLRGRSHDGRPGVHIVTPLEFAAGGTILVNRGWIPSADAATADPRPFRTKGQVTLAGILHAVPRNPESSAPLTLAVDGTAVPTYRRLDHSTLSDALRRDLPLAYLQLLPENHISGELPIPVPLPVFDDGPHLGYAIQWFSFAAIFLVGFAVVAGREWVRGKT
jgi:surfeit locus 1 family protein